MCFPNVQQHRETQFITKLFDRRLDSISDPLELVSIPAGDLATLLNGPGRQALKDLRAEATKQGTVAGDLLALIYQMHKRGLPEPSLGKAIEAYKGYALGGRYGDGDALKYSERMLREYWVEFASVAHLWAAFRLNQGPYAFAAGKKLFNNRDAFKTFLGVAAAVGDFATSFVPLRTKPPKPIIDP